eukprot:1837249-Prymnesium_polylepis.1
MIARGRVSPAKGIDFGDSGMGDASCILLAGALGACDSPPTIALRFNRISVDGAAALGLRLGNSTSLVVLNLNFNAIGSSGAVALSVGLRSNQTLKDLLLIDNSIDAVGCAALADALYDRECELKFLDVERNPVGSEGIEAIFDAVDRGYARNGPAVLGGVNCCFTNLPDSGPPRRAPPGLLMYW